MGGERTSKALNSVFHDFFVCWEAVLLWIFCTSAHLASRGMDSCLVLATFSEVFAWWSSFSGTASVSF